MVLMTKLLEQAFAEASKLPPEEQNALAGWLLKEFQSEKRWAESFAASEAALSKLASEAISEHRAGQTQELDASFE